MDGLTVVQQQEALIAELRAEVARLKAALGAVGDDYPGSSCQQWCYEQAGVPLEQPSPRQGKAKEEQ